MSLKKNTYALTIVQVATFIIPLLQIPHLTRVFGLELYGIIVIGVTVMQISLVIIDYGFSVALPGRVASNRDDKKYLSCLLGTSILMKAMLSLVPILAVVVFCYIFSYMDIKEKILLLYVALAIFVSISPIWLFHGLEKMWIAAAISLIAKIAALFFVFNIISDSNDILLVPLIQIGAQFASVVLMFYYLRFHGIGFGLFDIKTIKKEFFELFSFFISRLFVAVYSPVTNFVVAIIAGERGIAIYGASEQLYRAAQQIFQPVGQSLYPYMVRTKNYDLYRKVFFVTVGIALLVSIFGFAIGDFVIKIVYGSSFSDSAYILNIFMIVLVVYVVSMMLGYPILYSIGKIEFANTSVMCGGFVQIICLILIYLFNFSDLRIFALSVLVAEITVCIIRGFVVYKNLLKSKKFI